MSYIKYHTAWVTFADGDFLFLWLGGKIAPAAVAARLAAAVSSFAPDTEWQFARPREKLVQMVKQQKFTFLPEVERLKADSMLAVMTAGSSTRSTEAPTVKAGGLLRESVEVIHSWETIKQLVSTSPRGADALNMRDIKLARHIQSTYNAGMMSASDQVQKKIREKEEEIARNYAIQIGMPEGQISAFVREVVDDRMAAGSGEATSDGSPGGVD